MGHDLQVVMPPPNQCYYTVPLDIAVQASRMVNDGLAEYVARKPDHFVALGTVPLIHGGEAASELERCVKLGFVGCLLNPDPYENSGTEAPPLGDRYWYPLYEKLCELDVPAHIHGTGSRSERSPYSVHFINEESIAVFGLVNSTVFNDFPKLKIVVSHGGGAIPSQLGRF